MEFRRIAIADTVSAVVGGALGVIAALVGWGYWAIVVQLVATDALLLSVLLTLGAGWKPNIEFGLLRDIAGFSARAFGAGVLVNSVSRNVDNLLVGRFQGPQALAFYGLAYRLLLLPVQLANTTVGSVLFPVFSRLADDRVSLGVELRRATRILAVLFLPTMLLVSAAALQLVLLIFGRAWLPAVPIVQVLAVAGALQAIYQPSTSPLVLALGESRLNLRYAWLTTGTATIGFIAGLPFGPFGVAVGYTAATGLMVPVQWLIRRRLLGMTLRSQALSIIPGIHIAAWATAAYFAVSAIIPGRNLLILGIGTSVAAVVALVVLRFIHTPLWIEFLRLASRMIGRRGGLPKSQDGSSDLDNGASR
jgi:PST family polysaccharide transporter